MLNEDRQRALDALEILAALLGSKPGGFGLPANSRVSYTHLANRELDVRARRRAILGADLASDNCWELLLCLYLAWVEGKRTSVTDLSYMSSIPIATTIRWLNVLATKGVIVRKPDPTDGRRFWIRIDRRGIDLIEKCFKAEEELMAQSAGVLRSAA